MTQDQIERLCRALAVAFVPQELAAHAPREAVIDDHFIGHYCIVRSARAGVFAGVVESRKGQEVCMAGARRLWYWSGAASLSQLATVGTSKPGQCKFPAPVPSVMLFEVVEILPATASAEASIKKVSAWAE